jgi:hypothetical protein
MVRARAHTDAGDDDFSICTAAEAHAHRNSSGPTNNQNLSNDSVPQNSEPTPDPDSSLNAKSTQVSPPRHVPNPFQCRRSLRTPKPIKQMDPNPNKKTYDSHS